MPSERNPYFPKLNHDKVVFLTMKATGLPREAVEALHLTDEELDELCDSILSDLANDQKKVSSSAG